MSLSPFTLCKDFQSQLTAGILRAYKGILLAGDEILCSSQKTGGSQVQVAFPTGAKMKPNTYRLAVMISMTLCSAGSAFATPLSASMSPLISVGTDTDGEASDIQTSAASWGTLLSPLSVTVNATATNPSGTSAKAFASGSAIWAPSGLSGSVHFANYGWQFSGTTGSALLNQGTDWTYSFIADDDGQFTMNYNITGAGNTAGLFGWNIVWNGLDLLMLNPSDPTTSGSVTEVLAAGETYTVSLRNNANTFGASGAASMSGEFNWDIKASSVPEPASLALVCIGLAGLHWMRRRKT